MIKLIIFDLWHTLAYREGVKSTISEMLDKFHIKIPKEKFVKIFENSVQTKKWNSKYEAYKNLSKNAGLENSEKNIKSLMNIRDNAEAKAKLFPHTIPMLKSLRSQGYKTGLISNSSIFAAEVVKKKTDLFDYIDYPLFSFEVDVIKPEPKIFEKMLNMAKCRPEETIMIGDKLADDVEPAKALGMNAILFVNYEQLKADFANLGVEIR